MATAESVLKDSIQMLIEFPRTYLALALRPWRVHALVRPEPVLGVTPLPFLLICSFTFSLAWKSWDMLWGTDLEPARKELSESLDSGFNLIPLLLKSAPVFFAAALTAVAISKVLALVLSPRHLRSEASREIRSVVWYAVGFQILTCSILLLGPEVGKLFWKGLCDWAQGFVGFCDSTIPDPSLPGLASALLVYLGATPFLIAAGYSFVQYRRASAKPWDFQREFKPIGGTVLIGVGSLATAIAALLTLGTVDGMVRQFAANRPSQIVLLPLFLQNGQRQTLTEQPDSSVDIRMPIAVYNGSSMPILFDMDFGKFYPSWHRSEGIDAELDSTSNLARAVGVPPNSTVQMLIRIRCDTNCVRDLRDTRSDQVLEAQPRTPLDRGWPMVEARIWVSFDDTASQRVFGTRSEIRMYVQPP